MVRVALISMVVQVRFCPSARVFSTRTGHSAAMKGDKDASRYVQRKSSTHTYHSLFATHLAKVKARVL